MQSHPAQVERTDTPARARAFERTRLPARRPVSRGPRRIAGALVVAGTLALAMAGTAMARPALWKWPPWLSIESPVNPYVPDTRGAIVLVHANSIQGAAALADLHGTAEGLVGNSRRSVTLRFDATNTPGVFAVRRQWPDEGTWLLAIGYHGTTAIVALDGNQVVSARVPMRRAGQDVVPRAVARSEIDSTLAALTHHQQ